MIRPLVYKRIEMPLIVNKDEKIKFICDEAYKEFIEKGIEKFTLNKFVLSIGMSKGQFYHYFPTKEELIFEVISHKYIEIIEHIDLKISNADTFLAKLFAFFTLYIDNSDEKYIEFNKLMIDSFHMYVNSKNKKIRDFNKEMYIWIYEKIDELFDEEITKGNLIIESKQFTKSISATADGMYLQSLMIDDYNLKEELSYYLINIEKLLIKE